MHTAIVLLQNNVTMITIGRVWFLWGANLVPFPPLPSLPPPSLTSLPFSSIPRRFGGVTPEIFF